jgi:hypothetical protein
MNRILTFEANFGPQKHKRQTPIITNGVNTIINKVSSFAPTSKLVASMTIPCMVKWVFLESPKIKQLFNMSLIFKHQLAMSFNVWNNVAN